MRKLREFNIHWIEEPTCADDVLGHKAISEVIWSRRQHTVILKHYLQSVREAGTGVATGEACQNRVMFKQFLMSGAMQYCQVRAKYIIKLPAACILFRRMSIEYHCIKFPH